MAEPSAVIAGTGMSVPERVLTNADLERMVDTSDEWIVSRTGIRERRVAAAHETTATHLRPLASRARSCRGHTSYRSGLRDERPPRSHPPRPRVV